MTRYYYFLWDFILGNFYTSYIRKMEGILYTDAVKRNLFSEETAMEIAIQQSLEEKVLHFKVFCIRHFATVC